MKYLIVGASGLMGSTFLSIVPDAIGVDEKTFDITDNSSIEKYFQKNKDKFDVVINFAAFTNVDAAEKERGDKDGLVWKLNVEGVKNLNEICTKHNKFLIQISTDFVFEGTKENPGPYKEDTKLPEFSDKLGWYGWTKNSGERMVDTTINAVVRTAYPFRKKLFELKNDYAHGTLKLFDEGKLYPLFTDQKLTPILLEELIKALQKLSSLKSPGIYHVVSSDSVTPFEFGSYLIEKGRNRKGVVKKGSMVEFMKTPGRFSRPLIGGLDVSKTEKKLGMKFKTWKEMIDEFVS